MASVWSGCAARGYFYFSILLSFSAEIWPTLPGLLLQTPVPKGERQIKHQRDTVTTMQIKVCRCYLRKAGDSVRIEDFTQHSLHRLVWATLSTLLSSLRCIGGAAGETSPQVAIEILYSGGELLWQNTPGLVKHALTAWMKKKQPNSWHVKVCFNYEHIGLRIKYRLYESFLSFGSSYFDISEFRKKFLYFLLSVTRKLLIGWQHSCHMLSFHHLF